MPARKFMIIPHFLQTLLLRSNTSFSCENAIFTYKREKHKFIRSALITGYITICFKLQNSVRLSWFYSFFTANIANSWILCGKNSWYVYHAHFSQLSIFQLRLHREAHQNGIRKVR